MAAYWLSMMGVPILIGALAVGGIASEGPYSIIAEKNLFHPDRKKLEINKPDDKKTDKDDKDINKNISKIILYGIVQSGEYEYAVLRARHKITKSKQNKKKKGIGGYRNTLFMEGDYIDGFLISEINEDHIIITDETSSKDYEIFLNEGKKDRKPVKTEITEERWKKDGKYLQQKKTAKRKKARTYKYWKNRLKRNLRVLKRNKRKLFKTQARKDWEKLERHLDDISTEEMIEVMNMKKELDRLLQ